MNLDIDKILKYLIIFGLGLMVLALSPIRIDPLFSIKDDVFYLISTLLIIFSIIKICKNGLKINRPLMLLGLFILYMISTIHNSINVFEGLKESYRMLLLLGIILSLYQIDNLEKFVRRCFLTAVILAIITTILAILEYFWIPVLFADPIHLISLFGHENLLAQFLGFCLVWLVCALVLDTKYKKFYLISFPLILFGLLITNCRTQYLAVFISLIILLILLIRNNQKLSRIVFLLLAVAIILTVSYPFIEIYKKSLDKTKFESKSIELQRMFLGFEEQNFSSGRNILWSSTIELTKQNPILGTGIGNYWIKYPSVDPEYVDFSKYAHNDYLQILSEGGIIGFSFYLIFIILILVSILKYRPPDDKKLFFYGFSGSLFVILVDSVFSYSLYVPVPTYIFAVSTGILLNITDSQGLKPININKFLKIILFITAILLFVILCYFLTVRNIGFYHYLKGSLYIAEKDFRDNPNNLINAKKHLNKAIKYLPFEPEPLYVSMVLEMETGNFPLARDTGYRLLKLTPYEKNTLLIMAKLEAVLGNEGKSKDLFAKLAPSNNARNSKYVEQMLGIYNSFHSKLQNPSLGKESAIKMIDEISKRITEESNDYLYFTRAIMLINLGQWNEAVTDLNVCLQTPDKYPLGHVLRAMYYSRTGHLEEALKDYEIYLQFDSKSEAALLGCAIVYQKMGNLDKAEKQFKAVLSLNPDNSKALRNMGILKLSIGNELEAIKYFQKSLKSDPHQANSEDIRNLINQLKSKSKNIKKE